jgi:hypothetical protein
VKAARLLHGRRGIVRTSRNLQHRKTFMNWITRKFSRSTPFYKRPRTLGIAASVAAAIWGARVWQTNR